MYIVDNFLPQTLYDALMSEALQENGWVFVDNCGNRYKKFEKPLNSCYVDKIEQAYKKVLNLKQELVFSAGLVKCEPGYTYPVHADHSAKVISSVVYLAPKKNTGTLFNVEGEVAWKENRLVSWENTGQLHWYHNFHDEWRYTLNIYQTKGGNSFVVETL